MNRFHIQIDPDGRSAMTNAFVALGQMEDGTPTNWVEVEVPTDGAHATEMLIVRLHRIIGGDRTEIEDALVRAFFYQDASPFRALVSRHIPHLNDLPTDDIIEFLSLRLSNHRYSS